MKWTVGIKIGGGFGMALVILVIVGIVTYLSTTGLIRNADLVNHTHVVLSNLEDVTSALKDAETSQRGYLITGENDYLELYNAALKGIDQDVKELRKLTLDNAAQQRRLDLLEPLIADKLSKLREAINLRTTKSLEAALPVVAKGKKDMDAIRKVVAELEREETMLLQQRHKEAKASSRTTIALIVFGIPLSIIFLAAISFFIIRDIVQPLKDITASAELIAAGDLDVKVPVSIRDDEIGVLAHAFTRMGNSLTTMSEIARQIAAGDVSVKVTPQSERDVMGNALAQMVVSLNYSAEVARQIAAGNLSGVVIPQSANDLMGNSLASMGSSLRGVIGELIEGINVLTSSSSEIMASTSQVAAGASQTLAAVSETTCTVEEVKQTAMVSSQKARTVADIAQNTVQVAQAGWRSIDESIAGMGRIQRQVESIVESIVRLSEQSQTIGEIIATVNDLAEQSNILAVNAAIEAAKAGEQGKGFAVVAQEVKSLAVQSKEATVQIRAILNDIQKATNAAVLATEQGNKAVEDGVRQSKEASEAIRQMSESIDESAQAAIQIAASSHQQLTGMDQVALAMESICKASEQNLSGMKQVDSTVRGLHDLGQRLKDVVGRYKV
jgi:methyl-accepting chemotaxis protein